MPGTGLLITFIKKTSYRKALENDKQKTLYQK